jgi:DNA-3-methyladenine glycosylase II
MQYILHLQKDKKLKRIIDPDEPHRLKKRKSSELWVYLCSSIMSQQLSVKVADVIYQRFLNLYGGKKPKPGDVLNTPVKTLRSIGLSNAKATYVREVARFEIEKGLSGRNVARMDNEAFIAYVTQIKGVGRWTAEMMLMFALQREDVFSIDDFGIQQAMVRLYHLDTTDRKKLRAEMVRISEKWQPYRTYACLHLWNWKDSQK